MMTKSISARPGESRVCSSAGKKNNELLIIDILSGNGEARFRPEPEKIFANILSGELTKRDALLLINEEYLAVFSQKELGETILDNPAIDAAKIIDDSLREKISKKNYYAVIISPPPEEETPAPAAMPAAAQSTAAVSTKPFRDNALSTSPAAAQLSSRADSNVTARPIRKTAETQQSIDRLLVTQVRTEKYLAPSLLPQWQKIIIVIWTACKRSFFYILRQAKKLFLAGSSLIVDWQRKRSRPADHRSKPPQPQAKIPAAEDDLPSNTAEAEGIIIGENNRQGESAQQPGLDPIYAAGTWTEKINYFINGRIEKFLALKKSQQIVLIIGLILIFLFSQSVVMIGRSSDNSQNRSSADNSVAQQIATQLDNAEAQNIFNDETGAVQSIKKARELLAQIPNTRLNKSLISDLQGKIDSAAGALQKINHLDNPKIIADYSNNQTLTNLVGLAKTGAIFWTFDNLSKSLYRLDPATGKVTLATTSLPQIQKITAIDDKNLLLAAEGKIYYKFNIAKHTTSKIKPTKDYFQIKIPTSASPLIDPSLASSTIAMSVTSETYLFFLDGINGRVMALDKNGVLKRQYYSDKFPGATALAADAKNKKLFVFNANKVYQIDLDF